MRVAAVRRLVLHAQGYAARARRGTTRDVEAAIRRLSCVQLDSISAVERSHRIALVSRVGDYPKGTVPALLSRGRVFEYWAHEACLLPIETWPLFRPAMDRGGRRWYGNALEEHPEVVEHVLEEIEQRGPLGSRDFDGAGGGGMWNWKPAKRVLEGLWNHGRLVVADRQGFQRRYDLAERVVPRAVLDAPVPREDEILRTFALAAVKARGALTESGIVEHWRLRGGAARVRPHVDALVAEGALERVAVEDGGAPVVVEAGVELDRPAPVGGRPALAVRQPALGPAVRQQDPRLRPPDRGLQARARAALRLLRAPAALARPHRRARRPEGRPARGRARRQGVPPGARGARVGVARDALGRALSRLARSIGLEQVVR